MRHSENNAVAAAVDDDVYTTKKHVCTLFSSITFL